MLVGVSVGSRVAVGCGMSEGARVGTFAAWVEVAVGGMRVGTTCVDVACCWVAGGSVAGVTGVAVGVGTNVAVALGAALLQAVSSRIRMRKVIFFILSILQTNLVLVNPPLNILG